MSVLNNSASNFSKRNPGIAACDLWDSRSMAVVGFCAAFFGFSACAAAHPFHVSSAELEYNAESHRFEVSLRIQISDLELALSRLANRSISFEKTADIDRQIVNYLGRTFFLSHGGPAEQTAESPQRHVNRADMVPNAKLSKICWVGKEHDGLWAWLYFELEPPTGTGPLRLTNAVLVESVDQQINTCVLLSKQRKQSMTFDASRPQAKLE